MNAKALRDAAVNATPGPWVADIRSDGDGRCYANVCTNRHIKGFYGVIAGQKTNRENSQAPQRAKNIEYIAMASPNAVITLIDSNASLRALLTSAISVLKNASEALNDADGCPLMAHEAESMANHIVSSLSDESADTFNRR